MSQSHDLHHELYYEKHPLPSTPNKNSHSRHIPINFLNGKYTVYVKRGSMSDMDNFQGKKSENDDLKMG